MRQRRARSVQTDDFETDDAETSVDPRRPSPPSPKPAGGSGSDIDVLLVPVGAAEDLPAGGSGRWPHLEVWTAGSVYHFDVTLRCLEVTDRRSRERQEAHQAVGARLLGGQLGSGAGTSLMAPLPLPGSRAVLALPGRLVTSVGRTSTVERLLVRLPLLGVRGTTAEGWGAVAAWQNAAAAPVPLEDDDEDTSVPPTRPGATTRLRPRRR